jgi:hypothetical protein
VANEDNCNIEQLFGIIQATNESKLGGALPEELTPENSSPQAAVRYENVMGNNELAKGRENLFSKLKGRAAAVAKALQTKGFFTQIGKEKWAFGDFQTSSTTLPKSVWEPLDASLTDWLEQNKNNTYEEAISTYRRDILPSAQEMRGQLNAIAAKSVEMTPQEIRNAYAELGMKPSDAYLSRKYLNFTCNGSAFFDFSGDSGNWITDRGQDVMSSYVSWNPIVLFGHSMGFLPRAMAKYDPLTVFRGYQGALDRAGGNVLKMMSKHAELEEKGVYGNPFAHQAYKDGVIRHFIGKPLDMAQTLADNVAYEMGALKGDPWAALRDVALHKKPWDVEAIFQNKLGRTSFSLARYHLNFGKTYLGMYKQLVTGVLRGDLKQASAGAYGLAMFTLSQKLLLGKQSAIPFFPERKEDGWFGLPILSEEGIGLSQIPSVAGKIQEMTGVNLGGAHSNPLTGFAAGLIYNLLNESAGQAYKQSGKAIESIKEGNTLEAGTHILDTLTSMTALYGDPQQVVKIERLYTQMVRQEIDPSEFQDKAKEAIFSKRAVKQE